jgi:hypothetical protein
MLRVRWNSWGSSDSTGRLPLLQQNVAEMSYFSLEQCDPMQGDYF